MSASIPLGGDPPLENRLRNLILNHADQGAMGEASISSSDQAQGRPKASKKRLNQAQRRQMNAQLSIPVDTRAPTDHTPKPQGPYQPNEHQQHGRNYSHHHSTRSNSGAYRSGPQNLNTTNPSLPHATHRHHHSGFSQGQNALPSPQLDWRAQQPQYHGFPRGVNVLSPEAFPPRGRQGSHPSLYNPDGYRQYTVEPEELANQSQFLDQLCYSVVTGAEIELGEIAEKEDFRTRVEAICRSVITHYEIGHNENTAFPAESVQLKCFGSLSSGFATKTADMDLALLSPLSRSTPDMSDSPIPRLVEKALLEFGFGARLLTRTRVPIIKLCEKPDENLQLALLEERAKWEQGVTTDVHEAEDEPLDDINAPDDTAVTHHDLKRESISGGQRAEDDAQNTSEVGQTYEEKLASLRQTRGQSLTTYYNNAKRLLRQLDGRDITLSTAGDFTEDDFRLLNIISGAFIHGLYNESLKSRVQSSRSFYGSADFYGGADTSRINCRSLAGVVKMVEGEQLVTLWEERTLTEGNPQREEMSQGVVNRWKSLQSTKMFGTNPLAFTKDLSHAVESLRSLPSIQLMQLKQEQHESATDYHARVVRIMNGLRGPNVPNPVMASKLIEYYISGIHNEQLREEVRNFALTTGAQSLKTIARKHKALQLAVEYEKALGKNLYAAEDALLIQQYIALLRRDLIPFAGQGTEPFNYVVPVTQTTAALVQKVRQLPDPSRMAPNQPRDRYQDKLEFPKSGVGVQCDINFSAHLALQNTLLLRCYSYTDPRVRPLILFVKYWARVRGINNAYRGTLSSYGYVLMVLHYLVNVAEPFVCPNLQQLAPPDPPNLPPEALEGLTTCKGRNVRFWRDEQEIQRLAREASLNNNSESLGALLRGFFEYYAQNNLMSTIQKRGFDWGRDVISLRTLGGLLTKQEKGWTGAKTIIQPQMGGPPGGNDVSLTEHRPISSSSGAGVDQLQQQQQQQQLAKPPMETKEIRLRFLFAIEDPFETDHNVARTVTHNGIVSIRDEFRRAWRIIRAAGNNNNNNSNHHNHNHNKKTGGGAGSHHHQHQHHQSRQQQEDLLEDVKQRAELVEKEQFADLLDEIHGAVVFPDGV